MFAGMEESSSSAYQHKTWDTQASSTGDISHKVEIAIESNNV